MDNKPDYDVITRRFAYKDTRLPLLAVTDYAVQADADAKADAAAGGALLHQYVAAHAYDAAADANNAGSNATAPAFPYAFSTSYYPTNRPTNFAGLFGIVPPERDANNAANELNAKNSGPQNAAGNTLPSAPILQHGLTKTKKLRKPRTSKLLFLVAVAHVSRFLRVVNLLVARADF